MNTESARRTPDKTPGHKSRHYHQKSLERNSGRTKEESETTQESE